MFYRIMDNRIYDYADYEFAPDCLYTNVCTMNEFQKNPDIYQIRDGELCYVPNYQELLYQKRKEQFEKEFFKTSLGWIKRQVNMKDGSKRDFLADLLLQIKAGIEMGQNVDIITYNTPDFSQNLTPAYVESLQEVKYADYRFIQECLFQTVQDFRGVGVGVISGGNIEEIHENNLEEDTEISDSSMGGNDGI